MMRNRFATLAAAMAAGVSNGLSSLMPPAFPRDHGAAMKTRAKRRELTAAWRSYQPEPFTWNREGPRAAETYRAARRNARRRPKAA